MVLDFVNQGPESYDSYEEIFQKLYAHIFDSLGLSGEYFTDVTIVNNEQIHEINREYRNIDRPTDVISFAFMDGIPNKEELFHVVYLAYYYYKQVKN